MTSDLDNLSAQVRAGDGDAFRTLVQEYSRDVFRVVYRIIGDHQQAEDAVQETFIKVHRSLGSFDGRSRLTTWIHRIAVNCAIDFQRKQVRHEAVTGSFDTDSQSYTDSVESADPGPERLAQGSEIAERTRDALRNLTALERTAFTLRHYEGHSISEISSTLDINASAAKQAVFRAVRKLRHVLEPLMVPHERHN